MFKILPQVYDWFLRKIITRLYDEVKSIEAELAAQGQGQGADELRDKLDKLDQRASRLSLPAAFSLYTLRSHVAVVRNRLATGTDQVSR